MKLVLLAGAVFALVAILYRLMGSRGPGLGGVGAGGARGAGGELSSERNGARRLSDADIESLVLEGRKIEAIKLHRKLHGTGLREAKEAVEELASRSPR